MQKEGTARQRAIPTQTQVRVRPPGGCTLANRDYVARMEEYVSVQCPFCGQSSEVAIDTSLASQRFTTDCEVCCRPFEVIAECRRGEIVSLDVEVG